MAATADRDYGGERTVHVASPSVVAVEAVCVAIQAELRFACEGARSPPSSGQSRRLVHVVADIFRNGR
jgi:hypothetical protein